MELEILDPLEYPGWDDLLLTHEDYSFFHSSAWARILCESYGYKPLYFTSIENGRLSALIPVMEVKSFLTGKRGVSLPFSDYCEPIVPEENTFRDICEEIINYGKKSGWKYFELRGGTQFFHGTTPSSQYYLHTLDLSLNEEQMLSHFRDSTKRNIKKAMKEGVEVAIGNSLKSIQEFCRLNCITRKHHGLPPQPLYFFENIYEHILSKDKGVVIIASHDKKVIAGAVLFLFGKTATYKYGASDRTYQHLRPNNLIMWQAIDWSTQNGYTSLFFGKTESENKGLLQYKHGWGAIEKIVGYYRHDLSKGAFIENHSMLTGFHNKIFSKMPIRLLNIVGSMLYKHIG